MKNVTRENFISGLRNYHVLRPHQYQNAVRLSEVSCKFLTRAKIRITRPEIESDNTIILESGHQPNFLPHAGTWKKAFLLADIKEKLTAQGSSSIAFFGFPDRNLSTARLLSRNQIPALNKKGVEAIGFRIPDTDRMKSFCNVCKPPSETWQTEIQKIEKCYTEISGRFPDKKTIFKTRMDQIIEILWESYGLAGNFAELNGFAFAKICHEILDLDLLFFFYSDMQKEKLFIDESRKILQNMQVFNRIYNRVINEKGLSIPPVDESHVPFWYHCGCGGKVNLFLKDSLSFDGSCPLCKKEFHLSFDTGFNNLDEYFADMDFNAVTRNVVMAEGLGDTLFISGTGGSLQYGLIADQVSYELAFHHPVSLAWRSQDFYLGMTHASALRNLMKTFMLSPGDLSGPSLNEMICQQSRLLAGKLKEAQQKKDYEIVNTLVGMYNNANNWPVITRHIFVTVPSFIDILFNQDFTEIAGLWKRALDDADISEANGVNIFRADINYKNDLINDIKTEDVPRVYHILRGLEV